MNSQPIVLAFNAFWANSEKQNGRHDHVFYLSFDLPLSVDTACICLQMQGALLCNRSSS